MKTNEISLRDHFAGLAMQALLSSKKYCSLTPDKISEYAYEQADSMILKRNNNEN